jgi:hypothetical protein
MSQGETLKCQFCELKFSSTYKIIPHTFFGHKKKISKMVAKQGEIRILCPCAPAGCSFVQIQPVAARTSGQEEIFRLLASMLLGVETHVNTLHTGEPHLTACPYCQLSLQDVIYWEHLQEHMANNSGGGGGTCSAPTGGSPGKTAAAGGEAASASHHVKTQSPEAAVTSRPAGEPPVAGGQQQTEVTASETRVEEPVLDSVAGSSLSRDGGEKTDETLETKVPPPELEKQAQEPPPSPALLPDVRRSPGRPRTPPEPPIDEADRAVSPLNLLQGTPKAPEELAVDTIPFKVG